ncbi:MAG: hypothetical protein IH614_19730, partial [Desulfuromonadales bacterium]|nr:hypothetical protein [Desulfuromonadales bacterium]
DWPCRTLPKLVVLEPIESALNFDQSDYLGWHSAQALAKLQETLKGKGFATRLLAHSQGNVVAGEAIRLGSSGDVHTWIATQAAISGSFFHQDESEFSPQLSAPLFWKTPKVISDYPRSPAAPYWGSLGKVARKISYYNESDYALVSGGLFTPGWEFNNRTKPDDLLGYRFIGEVSAYPEHLLPGEGFVQGHYEEDPDSGQHDQPTVTLFIVDKDLRFPADDYEIFSFGAQSRAKALGSLKVQGNFTVFSATSDTVELSGSRNLKALLDFDQKHYSHSRQFRSNIVDEQGYWRALVIDSELGISH